MREANLCVPPSGQMHPVLLPSYAPEYPIFRLTKSTPEEYPWIQEFKSQYDYLIVGGGIVGSCIANALAERIKVGFHIMFLSCSPSPTL